MNCQECFWFEICAFASDDGWEECHLDPPFIPVKEVQHEET